MCAVTNVTARTPFTSDRTAGGGASISPAGIADEVLKQAVTVLRNYIDAWYDGRFYKLIFNPQQSERVRRQICSILAGYVWDPTNPLATQSGRKLRQPDGIISRDARS